MPRPLVFGNGNLLVGIDQDYCVRDLFYPQVGLYNHLAGHRLGMGVCVGAQFAWSEDPGWQRNLGYIPGSLTGHSILEHDVLRVRLEIEEAVSQDTDEFLRRVRVKNTSTKAQEVLLFFTHDLRIMESDIGDTALYNPYLDGLVHYKGKFYFLFGGTTSSGGVYEYATGIKGFGGLEGTWRDAEDGHLSMHPISQGSVDSTLSLKLSLKPGQEDIAYYWVVCGHRMEDVTRSYQRLVHDGFGETLDETTRYWQAWSAKAMERCTVSPEKIRNEFRQSMLVMRTQVDNQGAILAANDTDIMRTNRATYSYMWPRDGAFVSTVFDRCGYHMVAERFFEFCRKVLPHDRPVFQHKYMADGSVGATWHPWVVDGKPEMPFQEDESALTLHSLWQHYLITEDIEFIHEIYEPFVVPMADYIVRFRDPTTHLPLASYDLWEERRGIHTFTVAAVVAGLRAAAGIAGALGSPHAKTYAAGADETAQALLAHLYDDERGVFLRRLAVDAHGNLEPDLTIDSSTLQPILLGVVPPDDPKAISTVKVVESALWVQSQVGGLARYQGDYYFRVTDEFPGNPWLICTLWLAQVRILAAKTMADLTKGLELIQWAVGRASPSAVFSEQVHPTTGEPLSVSPLTWSHAEFVKTVLDYEAKAAELGVKAS